MSCDRRTGADTMSGVFVGVDLASQPRRTGIAVLRCAAERVAIEHLAVGATDDDVRRALLGADKAGIDVPLGWPAAFAELVASHARGTLAVGDPEAWRRDAVLRATDHHVRELTGVTPLSVATDRIAYPALRWAVLEASLREVGLAVDRSGHDGVVCEVYPAAALRSWGFSRTPYKGDAHCDSREHLIRGLSALMPWLEWGAHRGACVADDNALDAVVAALVALEVHRGTARGPTEAQVETARVEGWIWLPSELPRRP